MQPGKQLAMPMKFVPLMHQWAHLGRLVVIVSQSPQLGKTGRHDASQSCEVTVIPISFISSLVKMTSFHLLIWGLFCFSSYGALRCIIRLFICSFSDFLVQAFRLQTLLLGLLLLYPIDFAILCFPLHLILGVVDFIFLNFQGALHCSIVCWLNSKSLCTFWDFSCC